MDFHRRLTRFFRSRVSSQADAEDLAQDVLLRAHRARPHLRDEERVEAWLFRIAQNVLTDFYRKRARSVPDELRQEPVPHEEPLVLAELSRCIGPLLTQLSPSDRAALQAVDLGGMGQKAFAKEHGLSYSAAKSRVQRARRKLRDQLLRCFDVEVDARGRPVEILATHCQCEVC